jgi:hypothetical protein
MTHHKFFLVVSIFATVTCYGQNKLGVKVYHNTDLFTIKSTDYRAQVVTEERKPAFSRISVALELKKINRITHELEVFVPTFSQTLSSPQYPLNYDLRADVWYDTKVTSYALRYEVNKSLTNSRNRFNVGIGVAVNPYFVQVKYNPTSPNIYYWSTKLFGAALNFIPRFNYKITHRVSAEINFPFKIYDYRAQKERVHNPAIPIRHQQSGFLKGIFFEDAYTIRTGMTYLL